MIVGDNVISLLLKAGNKEQISETLFSLTKVFEIQDVLEGFYVDSEKALIEQFGIFRRVDNPGYVAEPPMSGTFDDDYFEKCDKYERDYSDVQRSPYIRIFDPSKMEKSEEDYFAEEGLIKDKDGIIWKSDFYQKKHERYVQYMRSKGIEIKADDLRKVAGMGMSFFEVKNIRGILESITRQDGEKSPDDNS